MNFKKHSVLFFTSLIGVIVVLGLHLGNADSIIYEETISKIVDYHTVEPAFARRQLTTFLINTSMNTLGISVGKAFVLINFSFLFISGYVLGLLAFFLSKNLKDSFISIIGFYLTFSVLFAFYQPIYSYDEPLQYTLILISLYLLISNQTLLFILIFTLSILTRETSILVIPGLFFLVNYNFKKNLFIFSVPVILFLVYLVFYFQNSEHYFEEFHYRSKFLSTISDNMLNLVSTLVSWLAVSLLPLVLILKCRKNLDDQQTKWIRAYVWSVVINTVVVLFTSKASETRLFALPLIFFWPFFGTLLIAWYKTYKTNLKGLIVVLVLGAIISSAISLFYHPTIGTGGSGLFQLYLSIYVFVVLFILFSKKSPTVRMTSSA